MLVLRLPPYFAGANGPDLNTATSGPACPDDPLKHHIGVQYQPAAGVILEAAVVEDSKTVKNIQIAVCVFLFGVSHGYLTKFTV
jgi:hypothetical protein